MTDTDGATHRLDPARRAAAIGALALVAAAVVVGAIGLVGDVGRLIVALVLPAVLAAAAWIAATRKGRIRVAAVVAAVAIVVLLAAVVLTAEGHGLGLVVVVALLAASVLLARYALRRDAAALKAQAVPGTPVGPARQGVLIMNLKSGGGKAERFDLVDECRRRGIEPVVLQRGDDMLELAQHAIDRGADVIGMAGGDGSQALVASVAAAADVPLVCIPAGTRNHFALDVGLDRDDVVGALDAFDEAVERRIDLAEVSGRVFVNNVSLGVYAKIIQSPEYRDAKRQTTAAMLPALLGPDAEPFDLHFTGPDGTRQDGAQTHPGLEQPLRADDALRVRYQGPARHRHARHRRGQGPRRHGRRRLRSCEFGGPRRPLQGLDRVGRPHLHRRIWCAHRGRGRRRGHAVRPAARVPHPARRAADPHPHLGARLLPGRTEVALDLVDAQRPGAGRDRPHDPHRRGAALTAPTFHPHPGATTESRST